MVSDRDPFQKLVSTVAYKQWEKQVLLLQKLDLLSFIPIAHECNNLIVLLITNLCAFQKCGENIGPTQNDWEIKDCSILYI